MKEKAIYYEEQKKHKGWRKYPFFIQGIYYLLTGLWPVINIESFMWITGPKNDLWLVKMVAVLSISIGITIMVNYRRSGSTILNYASALSFFLIDSYYVANNTISKVYMTDALIQLIFVFLLILVNMYTSHNKR